MRELWQCIAVLTCLVAGLQIAAVPVSGANLGRQRDEARAAILRMSTSERDRLERNWSKFKALPPHEREQLKNIDRSLWDDRQFEGGKLNAVKDAYFEFLSKLNPADRDAILSESDPRKRVGLIRRLMERNKANPRGLLSREQVSAMIAVLKRGVEGKLNFEDLESLRKFPAGDPRHEIAVLDLATRPAAEKGADLFRDRPLELLRELNKAAGNSGERPPRPAIVQLMKTLEWRLQQLNSVSDQDQDELFAQLPAAERDELMSYPPNEQLTRLAALAQKSRGDLKEAGTLIGKTIPSRMTQLRGNWNRSLKGKDAPKSKTKGKV
jgi:hypothetical protein